MLNNLILNKNLEIAILASLEAGKKILEIYNEDLSYKIKSDLSPITAADKAANEIIQNYLLKTNIPIISEENLIPDYSIRKEWRKFWLVDPLDGTKEFISKNGEFTVNISLIENNKPLLGVIFEPVTGNLYYADVKQKKAFIFKSINESVDISDVRKKSKVIFRQNKLKKDRINIVVSRSHIDKKTSEFINKQKLKSKILKSGSSLKFIFVIIGRADIYPRFGPTMEWDVAAADAICRATSVKILNIETEKELIYNKEDLRNPSFICM